MSTLCFIIDMNWGGCCGSRECVCELCRGFCTEPFGSLAVLPSPAGSWEVALQRGAVAEWCQQGERAGRVFRVLHGPSLVSSGTCWLCECPGQGMALVSWCDRWVRVNHHQHTQREQAMFQKLRNYQNLTLKLAKWNPDNCIQKRFLMSLKLQDCCS